MTGTESTHPNGLVRFGPEVDGPRGEHGLTVQTFVETKCENCGALHDVDLQHITKKQDAIGHVGDAWGLCKACRDKGLTRYGDYGGMDPDMDMRDPFVPIRNISLEEVEKLYPRGKPGEATEGPLKPGEVYVGAMKGGPFKCSHGNENCKLDHYYTGVSHPSDLEAMKEPYECECSHGKKNCDDNHYHGVKITDPCDEPGCLQPRGSHFHYKPTIYSNQIQIGTEEAERVAFESDLQKRTREESGHVPAEIREAVMKDSSILRMKDEASAYFDAEARKDDLARETAKVSQLRNLDIGVTKKWADVSL